MRLKRARHAVTCSCGFKVALLDGEYEMQNFTRLTCFGY